VYLLHNAGYSWLGNLCLLGRSACVEVARGHHHRKIIFPFVVKMPIFHQMANIPHSEIQQPTAVDQVDAGLTISKELAEAALAPSTRKVYRRAFAQFSAWCEEQGIEARPATAAGVASYIGTLHSQGLTPSRIAVIVAAIGYHHREVKVQDPTVDPEILMVLRGTRRRDAGRSKRKARALLAQGIDGHDSDIQRMAATMPGADLVALRNRALLLLGFAGAFRRSELAGLAVGDLDWRPDGLVVVLRRSKADQEGTRPVRKAILPGEVLCPIHALKSWLAALEAATGREGRCNGAVNRGALPVFVSFGTKPKRQADGTVIHVSYPKSTAMSDQVINQVLKAAAAAAGIDPSMVSGHSLRRGYATSSAIAGNDVAGIRDQLGHSSVQMTISEYVQPAEQLRKKNFRSLL